MSYEQFLSRKAVTDPPTGLGAIPALPGCLFGFQRDIVAWALRRGRAALFAGTGLGKSLMELSWAHAVADHTGLPVLILTPLAVAAQFVREGGKFGLPCHQVSAGDEIDGPGVYVTNYAKMDHFDLSRLGGIVLDESSILKAQDGKTRGALIQKCQAVPFRLAASATPAPNDFMELGNHAEFLGIMSHVEMLAMFFTHDGGDTSKWRLKGHGQSKFWEWMASWAVMLQHPRDLGYEQAGYDLPPLYQHQHTVAVEYRPSVETGTLFPVEARTMQERLGARRDTIAARVSAAADLVNGSDTPWVVWCHLNAESEALARAIPGAREVRGSDLEAAKEATLNDFAAGNLRVLVSKPSICGYGLNWQHCADTVFVGLNDSYEQVYQAIRRFWRFGQPNAVNVHFVASELEGAVVENIRRKEAQAEEMARQMVAHTADLSSAIVKGSSRMKAGYQPGVEMAVPSWLSAA